MAFSLGNMLSGLRGLFGGGMPSLPQSQGQYMLNQGDMGEALNPLLAAQPGNRMVGSDLYTLQNRGASARPNPSQQMTQARTMAATPPAPFMGQQTFGQGMPVMPNYTGLLGYMGQGYSGQLPGAAPQFESQAQYRNRLLPGTSTPGQPTGTPGAITQGDIDLIKAQLIYDDFYRTKARLNQ